MSSLNPVEKMLLALDDHTTPAFDERTLNDMLAVMGEEAITPSKPRRWGFYLRLVASAAVLLIVLWLPWVRLSSPPSRPVEVVDIDHDAVRSAQLRREQVLAKALYSENDLAGLRRLLETGLPETQIAAASMLSDLGDLEALGLLQKLASSWFGDPTENPFQAAIEQLTNIEPNVTFVSPNDITDDTAPIPTETIPATETGIAGVVVDERTGESIVGAELWQQGNDETVTLTDTNGRFIMKGMNPRSNWTYYVVASGYASQAIKIKLIPNQILTGQHVSLRLGSIVIGKILDTHGQPVAGVSVEAFRFVNRPAKSESDGSYVLEGFEPGVNDYSLDVTHPHYPATGVQDISPGGPGETVVYDIVLPPGITITGTVIDVNGNPIADVQLGTTRSDSMWDSVQDRTDAEGYYELRNVKLDSFVLWARKAGYAPMVLRKQFSLDETKQRMDIQMPPAVPLRGQVLDQTGLPVRDVRVTIDEYEGVHILHWDEAKTDAEGRFLLSSAPASGLVLLNAWNGEITGEEFQVDWTQEVLTLDVIRSGGVYGQVIDAYTDRPIPEFKVKVNRSERGTSRGSFYLSWTDEGHAFNSSRGYFNTVDAGLGVGSECRVTVFVPGYDPLTVDPAKVQAVSEDPNRIVFRMQAATVLSGRVIDEEGLPVVNASVFPFSQWENVDTESRGLNRTDQQGVFVLSAVRQDQLYFQVVAEGHVIYVGHCADLKQAIVERPDIVSSQGNRLFGIAVNEVGRPLADSKVFAYYVCEGNEGYFPSAVQKTITNDQGYYEFTNMPVGTVFIEFGRGADVFAGKKCTLKANEAMQVDFGEDNGHVLSGVLHRGETHLEGRRVFVSIGDCNYRGVRTNSDGTFRVVDIPAGSYQVTFFDLDLNHSKITRQVTMDKDIEIDVDITHERDP